MSINLTLSSILCKILVSGHKLFRALKKDSMKGKINKHLFNLPWWKLYFNQPSNFFSSWNKRLSFNVPLKLHVVEVERQGKA